MGLADETPERAGANDQLVPGSTTGENSSGGAEGETPALPAARSGAGRRGAYVLLALLAAALLVIALAVWTFVRVLSGDMGPGTALVLDGAGAAGSVLIILASYKCRKKLGPVRERAPEKTTSEQVSKKTFTDSITAIAALGALILSTATLWETTRQNRDQLRVTEQGQDSDRFTKAIEQLASDKLSIRLGAVYSLRSIGKENPRYREQIVRVLGSFAGENSIPTPCPLNPVAVTEDVEAAAQAVGDLPLRSLEDLANRHGFSASADTFFTRGRTTLCWIGVHLPGAVFRGFSFAGPMSEFGPELPGTDFSYADLSGADLRGAYIGTTRFRGTKLSGANLNFVDGADGIDMRGADLLGAWLHSSFAGAQMCHANLIGAHLDGTHLEGANLEGAHWPTRTSRTPTSTIRPSSPAACTTTRRYGRPISTNPSSIPAVSRKRKRLCTSAWNPPGGPTLSTQ